MHNVVKVNSLPEVDFQSKHEARLLASALNTTRDAFCLTNRSHQILFVNSVFSETYGYTSDEIVGRKIDEILPLIAALEVIHRTRPAGHSSETWHGEMLHRKKDGSDVPVECWIQPIMDDSNLVIAFGIVSHNISNRKRIQEEQQALFRIVEAADRAGSIDDLYRRLHAIISDVMPASNFYIALYDSQENLLSFPYFVDEVDVPSPPKRPGKGLTEYVLRKGESVLCTSALEKELHRRGEVELVGAPSPVWLGVPLIVDEQAIGVMVVQHYTDASAYGEQEKQFLEFVSSQIANAIEQKRSEDKLRESERRMREMLENVKLIAIFLDSSGGVTFCNDHFLMMTGWRKDEVVGKNWFSHFIPSSLKDIQEMFREGISSGNMTSHYENPIVTRNGDVRTISWNNTLIRDPNGKIVGTMSIGEDITDRRRAEETLKRSEEMKQRILEGVPVGVIHISQDGRFLHANSIAQRFVGLTFDEITNRFVADYEPDTFWEDGSKCRVEDYPVTKCLATGEQQPPATIGVRRPDGTMVWGVFTAMPLTDPTNGSLEGVVVTFLDITERKRIDQAIRESEEKYRTLFEESQDGIILSRPDGKILDANPAAIALVGYRNREELLSIPHAMDLYAEPENRAIFSEELSRRGFIKDFEFEILRADGQRRIVLESSSAVRNEHGEIIAYRGFLRDITDRKKLEEQLRQAQKMEGIGTLAGGIAHDFNNILGIILGYTQLLESGRTDGGRFSKSLEAIRKAVERGADLVRQLLTFARKADPSFDSLNVNETVLDLSRMLKETFPRSIAIDLHLTSDLPPIIADGNQVHQALLNLCVNSRDAILERQPLSGVHGAITLETRILTGEIVSQKFGKASAEKYILVAVRDNGIGMDEETKRRIFEPFFTTKELGKGTGLGLAVVYGVVNSHHAFVDVESQRGRGTTFTLYFPVAESKKTEPEISEPVTNSIEPSPASETVLLVEDEEMLLDLLKSLLESQGFTVLTAKDGQEGVDMYRANYERISVILSDMGLPKLGGWEMFQQMKAINPNVRAILASGFFDPNVKMDLVKAGALDFIQKPYVAEDIVRRIREAIALPQPS